MGNNYIFTEMSKVSEGDVVLISGSFEQEDVLEIRSGLEEVLPGVRFVFLNADVTAFVVPAGFEVKARDNG